jgi:hypothetical protein
MQVNTANVIAAIVKEFDFKFITAENITNIEINDFNFCFSVNGGNYFSKLTSTGKHKKNSIRKAIY